MNFAFVLQENLSKPLRSEDVDASSGILIPYYDFDTKVMFLAGKVIILLPFTHISRAFIIGIAAVKCSAVTQLKPSSCCC